MTDFDVGKLMFDLQEAIEAIGMVPSNMLASQDISQLYISSITLALVADNARMMNDFTMGTVQ